MPNKFIPSKILQYTKQMTVLYWLAVTVWTIFIVSISIWFLKDTDEEMLKLARQEAIVNFKKDLAFRAWGSNHGGVYVPITKQTPPNPYLKDMPERDLITSSGKKLTLLNPAYMLRQLMDSYSDLYGVKSHLTSLRPLNIENIPSAWERKALVAFENGEKELFEVIENGTTSNLHIMRPMIAQEECLACHLNQGYALNDVLGGVSVIVPLQSYIASADIEKQEIITVFILSWSLGLFVICLGGIRSQQRIQERIKYEEKIWHQANFDPLTGLANRNLFMDRLDRALAYAQREKNQLAMLFIDLDRFKDVNDTRGHAVGDQLLKEASNRLKTCIRKMDTVSRLGGDEFTVILPNIDKGSSATIIANKILVELSKPFKLNDYEAHLSASIGITLFPQDGEDSGTLLKNADTAMYCAKAGGHDTYRFFTLEMNQETNNRVDLEQALHRAIDEKEFVLYYQPILNTHDNSLIGAEALIRWHPKNQKQINPGEFIPLAEKSGLIIPLGDWVFQQAASDMAQWDMMGLNLPSLAVNVSSAQFRMVNFCEKLLTFIKNQPHLYSRLTIEITESAFMGEYGEPGKAMIQLREQGINIAIDDFGTGYSSLGYLKRFPVDHIKIDHSFIRDVTSDTEDAALCEAIIAMAHHLGLQVVAEGVETEQHWQFLRERGCDFVQGYYFGRPMPAADFSVYMRQFNVIEEETRRPNELIPVNC